MGYDAKLYNRVNQNITMSLLPANFKKSDKPIDAIEDSGKLNVINLSDKSLIEELAELEHIQWVQWTDYMMTNYTSKNIERWKRQVKTPYRELSEKEKDSDREWAQKVISIIRGIHNES